MIVVRQDGTFHFREHAGNFYAGGSTAYNNDIEQFLLFKFGSTSNGALDVREDGILQSHRLINSFHRHCLVLYISVTEKIRGCSGCQNQIIVFHLTDGGLDKLLFWENSAQFSHAIIEVFLVLKVFAKRKGDGTGFHSGRRYLIDKRRKLVVVVFINENYLIVGAFEFVGQSQATETSTHDYNPFSVAFFYVQTHTL